MGGLEMTALIVGADHVEPIRQEIVRLAGSIGISRTEHWSGRKTGDVKRAVPGGTRLIVVMCDRISHPLLSSVRKQAEKLRVPVIFCRHSIIDMREKLSRLQH
jgi:hypothetical protein